MMKKNKKKMLFLLENKKKAVSLYIIISVFNSFSFMY